MCMFSPMLTILSTMLRYMKIIIFSNHLDPSVL